MLLEHENKRIRVLSVLENCVMTIDCDKRSMPQWENLELLKGYVEVIEKNEKPELAPAAAKKAYERYNMISSILPYIGNIQVRTQLIHMTAQQYGISEQTVRKYLCDYLAIGDVSALAPAEREQRALTSDEKIMRKSLNKWFYNTKKKNLKNCYTLMLAKYYCDEKGQLLPEHPSLYQFRYFFRKYNQKSKELISRNGLSFYQRNQRPLIDGNGVQGFSVTVGMGMVDATVCDIYLVNKNESAEVAEVIGRPVLTLCVDAFSGLICGYSLELEGGIYSVRNMLVNVIADKVELCRKFGIEISNAQWPSQRLPLKLVTDQGSEYKGCNLEQLADLGIEIINLKSYRAELKGTVEKAFDLIQGYMEPYLKGFGYVEPNTQEKRGLHDYRKDACLTLKQYEKILLHCIIFFNSSRVIENFRLTEEMITDNLRPIPCEIWAWAEEHFGSNTIDISREQLIQVLLPRITATFTIHGLKVNGMYYHNKLYQEQYLSNKEVTVAFNPDSANYVFLIENGAYIQFELTESRYKDKTVEQTENMKKKQREIVKGLQNQKTQAEIDLARNIKSVLAEIPVNREKVSIKNIRENRLIEKEKIHKDFGKELIKDE